MNIDAIRQIPLVDFLNHLGYQPTGRDSKGLWFRKSTNGICRIASMFIGAYRV